MGAISRAWMNALAAVGLTLAGCGRIDINRQLSEALRLAEKGDQASWEKARKKVDACRRAGADTPAVEALRILALMRTGHAAKARDRARDAVRDHGDSFVLNYLLGKLLHDAGNDIEALGYLRTAHGLRPGDLNDLVLLADSACRQNVPEAPGYYRRLMRHESYADAAEPLNELAIWHVQQGRYPEAMSLFSQALQKGHGNPIIYLNIAVMYDRHMQNAAVARRFYVKFLVEAGERFPDQSQAVTRRLRRLAAPS